MIIEPKIKGFICTTAHPKGCEQNVLNQIKYVKNQPKFLSKKNVLVIGCSTGYGLASRIVSAFSSVKASTIGVMFEKAGTSKKTATAGYYNTMAFEKFATNEEIYAKTINGDAFLNDTINETINLIKTDLKKIDLIVYSLAAPRRILPDLTIAKSTLKPINNVFQSKTLNLVKRKIEQIEIEPATETEIEDTIKVMGGENWFDWINSLKKANVLSNDVVTIAYSYVGPELTFPIYKNGTIGMAKNHLFETSKKIETQLGVKSLISMNKAVVTQASAAIPVVPLYLSILFKIMKEKNLHENCVEQIYRLFSKKINFETDLNGIIRLDDWELNEEVQTEVEKVWFKINNENLEQLADLDGVVHDFKNLFGFDVEGINYSENIEL